MRAGFQRFSLTRLLRKYGLDLKDEMAKRAPFFSEIVNRKKNKCNHKKSPA
jgi:hypothetical protein